ncbi:galactosylceramide sulfotransferase-like [Diadema setosum]|uniref:galactosylceramide sulfotransferase-like n=1 Tax=Diadema setosum TaxID=31175 RepID=UPI003B3A0962
MARRRVIVALLAVLVIFALFLISTLVVTDKRDSLTRHLTILDHSGLSASRSFDVPRVRNKWMASGHVRKPYCHPHDNVVFVKTHKTASSTTSGIFDHYAYKNNLTVAVPPGGQPYMDRKLPFQRDMIAKTRDFGIGWRKEDGFNMLTSHARYNRPEMDAVVHNAKYVTILRDPRSQFVSSFVYFNFADRFERIFEARGEAYPNVIDGFFRDPAGNYRQMVHRTYSHVLWNQQIFDLGLNTSYFDDQTAVDETIARLAEEVDLVMITEYYDESLLLLRDTLCWDTEDILYTQRLVRNSSSEIPVDEATRQRISEWNAADTRLYDYFNRTLWQRIAAYGPRFDDELRRFRQMLQQTSPRKTGKHSRDTKKLIKRMKDRGILVR